MGLARIRIIGPLWWSMLAAAFAPLGACAPDRPEVAALALVDFRPRQRIGVYLNEPLVLHFSSELDRASITADTVHITSLDGSHTARGARFVAGRELTFLPDQVRAPDLRDGGYLPDTTYVLELAGFPRADSIRSKAGACLAKTLRIEFRTVSVENRLGEPVFLDYSDDKVYPLLLPQGKSTDGPTLRRRMTPQSGLELECEEPIDPSTVSDDVFSLVPDEGPIPRPEYRLRAVLVENYNKRAYYYQGTTKLRLLPASNVPLGTYTLRVNGDNLHIKDFSGRKVSVLNREILSKLRIPVIPAPGDENVREYVEEFLDKGKRSSALVEGSDGTAFWSNSGLLEVRFPRAAGDGSQGELLWSGQVNGIHVQASRLAVPEGATCELDAGSGLARLCSQGALEIAGKLRRLGDAKPAVFPEAQSDETLSHWLERQQALDAALTVLVAGGDLRISGELEVPGPLLLVAGGRIRVSGRIRIAGYEPLGASFFMERGEGGAIAVWGDPKAKGAAQARVADAPLVLDPPQHNPLVRGLCFAVRSNPIPGDEPAKGWLSSELPSGRAGSGSLRARYAGERGSPGASGEIEVMADDPSLLVDCPTLRLVLELQVPPASAKQRMLPGPDGLPGTADDLPAWDPPLIDAVRVRWKRDR
ncbi:MAG TPA: hypothetical protein VK843_09130 [Planctomycetota bacterium]|nr:hypothetical protein [Planctomycetota bacterium]